MTKPTIKIKFFVPYKEKQEGAADFFFHMLNQWGGQWGGQKYDFVSDDDGHQSALIIFWGRAYPPAFKKLNRDSSKKFDRITQINKEAQSSLWQSCGSMPLRLFLTGEPSDFSAAPFLKYFLIILFRLIRKARPICFFPALLWVNMFFGPIRAKSSKIFLMRKELYITIPKPVFVIICFAMMVLTNPIGLIFSKYYPLISRLMRQGALAIIWILIGNSMGVLTLDKVK